MSHHHRHRLTPVPAWLPTTAQLDQLELQEIEGRLREWGNSSPRLPYPIAPTEQWTV